jgi:tritrans,polycis-undecaprenyl-diphosphate synthase [geranylgeranyl-diphosphate specific]
MWPKTLYARILGKRIRTDRLPSHVAIIPDGNRRWARRRGMPSSMGHYRGYKVAKQVLDRLWDLGINYVTFYALSRENCLRRPREELEAIYRLLSMAIDDLFADDRVRSGEVRVYFVGDFSLLPNWLREKIYSINEATMRNGPYVLNVATCYGGRWEIVATVNNIINSLAKGNNTTNWLEEDSFRKLMPLGQFPEPDLLIRTGGEIRLSGFLLYHVAYTELYFTKKLWPDFDEVELYKAILSYQSRERRFGR